MLNTKESELKNSKNQHKEEEEEEQGDQNNIIQGLLFIGNLRNIRFENEINLNIIIKTFWSDEIITKEFSINNKINFLEIFSVKRNELFLEKVRNNHLLIELHQKDNKVLGVSKFPLHQFFIAFKDSEITTRLFQETLPVISIDDWIPVINPITNDCYGYLQSLLAMGTNQQITNLKEKHNLSSIEFSENLQLKINKNSCNDTTKIMKTFCNENNNSLKQKFNGITKNHLGNFIENLLQQRNLNNALTTNSNNSNTSSNNNTKQFEMKITNSNQLQTKKTSDLLDTLNKALTTPPPNENDLFSFYLDQFNPSSSSSVVDVPKFCKILIEIERAIDLPRNVMKIGNKKLSKRSSNNGSSGGGGGKRKQSRFTIEEEPSAYVTFHAAAGYGQMVKSHEGFVYVTNVVERNCSPIWGKKFEVPVPLDLFTNAENRFILKVWRKISTDLAQCRFQPLPMEDIVIGFSSIDLNSLSNAACAQISEWYDICDHNGRIHGKLKIKIEPLENLNKLKMQLNELNLKKMNHHGINNTDFNNTPLSRAIKRKFTELEEITERLKARLLGVTGDLDENEEEDDIRDPILEAQLDEFEHDLNTVCDEEDDDDDENDGGDGDEKYKKNFDWSSLSIQNFNMKENNNHEQSTIKSEINTENKIQNIKEIILTENKTDATNTLHSVNLIINKNSEITNTENKL